MGIYDQYPQVNSARLNHSNYGLRTVHPLPPWEVAFLIKDQTITATLIQRPGWEDWSIVGWTDNPPFQHTERGALEPDVAFLFESQDGELAWWHFASCLH